LILQKASAALPHEGGKRFAIESPEYAILRRWIEGGMCADSPNSPVLTHIDVTPREQFVVEPADRVQFRVLATFSNGTKRDVTRLAVFEPSNQLVSVSADGVASRQQMGETAILVRYLDQRVGVALAFVPARPGFTWANPPEANYIDHHVFAKLRALREN